MGSAKERLVLLRTQVTGFVAIASEDMNTAKKLRAQYTNGPRDVARCGALSLLQKPLHYKEGSA
jgi:hypothetical protein